METIDHPATAADAAHDRLTDARLRHLEAQVAGIAVVMRKAVTDGLRDAVADPRLWDAAAAAMRQQASAKAGGWLLGGIGALATRAAWVVAVFAAVYALGGWGAVVALVKTHGAH